MPGNADPVPLHPGDDVFELSPGAVAGDRLAVPVELVTRPPRSGSRPISRPRPIVTGAIAAKNARSSPPARRALSDASAVHPKNRNSATRRTAGGAKRVRLFVMASVRASRRGHGEDSIYFDAGAKAVRAGQACWVSGLENR